MKLKDIYSLHRDFVRLFYVIWRRMEMKWLSTMHYDVMYAIYGCVHVNK